MNTTKTLMLAAVTALSLGLGTAMAQEQSGPSFAPTWSVPALPSATVGHQASQNGSSAIQFGASDSTRNEDLGTRAYDAYSPYAGGN